MLRASKRGRIIAAGVFLGILGCFALAGLVGRGRVRLIEACGFEQKYELPCPTCEMTASVVAFSRGQVLRSFYIQPAGGLICSLLVIGAFLAFTTAVFGVYFRFVERIFREVRLWYWIIGLIVVIGTGWAVTLARALATRSP